MADAGPAHTDGVADEGLDARIRRLDPDRWLASRFIADPERRAEVIAIYALNDELARVGETVSQPLIGEIRLAWWRDRIEDLFNGRPVPAQPTLQALSAPIAEGRLPQSLFEALIEARHLDLDVEPFADAAALARYLDGTAGAVMGLAARALSSDAPLTAASIAPARTGPPATAAGSRRIGANWMRRGLARACRLKSTPHSRPPAPRPGRSRSTPSRLRLTPPWRRLTHGAVRQARLRSAYASCGRRRPGGCSPRSRPPLVLA
jgi:phytoene synthase